MTATAIKMEKGTKIRVVKALNSKLRAGTEWQLWIHAGDKAPNHLFQKLGKKGQGLSIMNDANVAPIPVRQIEELIEKGYIVLL
jgi:hypothetical protein